MVDNDNATIEELANILFFDKSTRLKIRHWLILCVGLLIAIFRQLIWIIKAPKW